VLTRTTIALIFISLIMSGCSKMNGPDSSSSSAGNVTMSAVFSNSAEHVGLAKASSSTAIDSIRIDSAIVVFARIKFESDIDTVIVDTSSSIPFIYIDDNDSSTTFPGPFIVHVHDTTAIDFAGKTLPAGTYTGIKFDIHRVGMGERCMDSDDFNHSGTGSGDSAVTNYSIVVWGAVYKDSAWVPFEFKDNQNLQFKIKGTFTISSPTSSINIALNFNMGSWFTNPYTGATLDPTDMSWRTQGMIMQAIRLSFNDGRCGRWDLFRRWGF